VMKEAREQVFGGGEISPSLLIGCWIWIGVMALAEVGLQAACGPQDQV